MAGGLRNPPVIGDKLFMRQSLNEISRSDFHNKPISVRCIVSGKSIAPYAIPKTVTVKCEGEGECHDSCKLKTEKTFEIKAQNERILSLIDIDSHRIPKILTEIFGIKCEAPKFNVIEVQNVERIFISQPTGGIEQSKWSQARQAFYIGFELDVNTIYNMSGYTTVDPVSQTVTHVFTEAVKAKSDIESFILSTKMHDRLSQFSIESDLKEDYFERLEKIYTGYAHNITKIHKRFLLHLAVDMVFHSVVDFNFDNEYVKKGWVDAMIIGDSSIGKGYVAERLTHYFGVGEVVSAELCSFAGLVGGLQKYNQHWVITWGKIPMNDRGLVVIDEGSNMVEDWVKLTRVRSEGVVEITKIQSQIANARTRLLTLANPAHGKTVANYSYGIQAIHELVPAAEDIRRFDYIYVASHNEVPVTDINMSHKNITPFCSRQLDRDLIMWIWNKNTDDVEFTDDAVKIIYKRAIRLSEVYDSQIPLIQAENVRIKLAKLSICFAGRFYSCTDKGKKLLVRRVHVECASVYFHLIYKTEASGYYVYSKLRKEANKSFNDQYLGNIELYMKSFRNADEVYRCLLQNNSLTVNDLIEHLSERKEIATEIISKLLQNNCIIRRSTYYVKTPPFTAWLKTKLISDQMKGI